MNTLNTIRQIRNIIREARNKGESIALVPTMGYLHQGHLELIRTAKKNGQWVVVSIFVNPLQFGPSEDFASYPRDLERDIVQAMGAGADVIFAPEVGEMYPEVCLSGVDVQEVGNWLCGKSRPGHFRGVCTVVSKLFNIVQPDQAYFGEKDAQQLAIIRQMVMDLNYPVEVVGVPIVREPDGLALSSRNVYLTSIQRAQAPIIYQSLQLAKELYERGERESRLIKHALENRLGECSGAEIDYVEITDSKTLQPVERLGSQALVAVAVRFGKTRLIDNITLLEA